MRYMDDPESSPLFAYIVLRETAWWKFADISGFSNRERSWSQRIPHRKKSIPKQPLPNLRNSSPASTAFMRETLLKARGNPWGIC